MGELAGARHGDGEDEVVRAETCRPGDCAVRTQRGVSAVRSGEESATLKAAPTWARGARPAKHGLCPRRKQPGRWSGAMRCGPGPGLGPWPAGAKGSGHGRLVGPQKVLDFHFKDCNSGKSRTIERSADATFALIVPPRTAAASSLAVMRRFVSSATFICMAVPARLGSRIDRGLPCVAANISNTSSGRNRKSMEQKHEYKSDLKIAVTRDTNRADIVHSVLFSIFFSRIQNQT